MKKMRARTIFIAMILLILVLYCGSRFFRSASFSPAATVQFIHDTVILSDTVIRRHETVRRVKQIDTAVVVMRDTVRDTVYVSLPIEERLYTGTVSDDSMRVNLRIAYHGYRAAIDTIQMTYDRIYTTRSGTSNTPSENHKSLRSWGQFVGVGISAGYGIGKEIMARSPIATPFVGVSVTYGWGYRW